MGKTKEVFTETTEQEIQQEYHEQQRQMLNEIFEAWGEIYGVKRVTKSNENESKDIILITQNGSFIKHSSKSVRISKKGEIGTMGIKLKDSMKKNNRIVDAFINDKYVSLLTNKSRYESLKSEEINSENYKKEKTIIINLDQDEIIESVFPLIAP